MGGRGQVVGFQRPRPGRRQQQQIEVQLGEIDAYAGIRGQPQAGLRVQPIGEPHPHVAAGDRMPDREARLGLPQGAQRLRLGRRRQPQMHGVAGAQQGGAGLQHRWQRLGANDDGDTGQGSSPGGTDGAELS